MNQDSYFQVRRFELVDRVPTIEIYVPADSELTVSWLYSNEHDGTHAISLYGRILENTQTIEAPFPVKPGQSVWVEIETDFGNYNGTLHAPPTDKADEPN